MLQKYYRFLLGKLRKRYLAEYYTSLDDLPVWNWWEVQKGEFKHLLKDSSSKLDNRLESVLEQLHEQYIKEFGLDSRFKKILRLRTEIQILKNEKAITGDLSKQIFIDVKEVELKALISNTPEGSNKETTAAISKFMGFPIIVKKISVIDYYSNIELMKKSFSNGRK